MRDSAAQEIKNKINELRPLIDVFQTKFTELRDSHNKKIQLETIIPQTDSSTYDIIARTTLICELSAAFKDSSTTVIAPKNYIDKFKANIDSTKSSYTNAISLINNITTAGGATLINNETFQIIATNGNNYSLQQILVDLFNKVEELSSSYFYCLSVLNPKNTNYNFNFAAKKLIDAIENVNNLLTNSTEILEKVNKLKATANSSNGKIEEILTEVTRLKTEASSERKTISEYLSTAIQESTNISSINEQAKNLENNITEYKSKFDIFENQLDSRNTNFSIGSKKLNNLIESYESQLVKVNSLIETSEKMVSGATVAGLASAFGKTKDDLTIELASARTSFLRGIIFLFISSLPLIWLILAPGASVIIQTLYPSINISGFTQPSPQNGWQYLGQVASRLIVLLPAAWFVSFSAIRYSSLFRLREHYAYKYSMAFSVEGFKMQAPSYEQEIATLVFEQLSFNPADKLVPSKKIPEGKIPFTFGYIMEKMRKKINSKELEQNALDMKETNISPAKEGEPKEV